MKDIINSLKALALLSLVTGFIYPFFVTGVAQLSFPTQANGSGSLIAQEFKSAKYFHARPSAISYNPMPSGGSNLGPTSDVLRKQIQDRASAGASLDMLTASGSGLDPHISPDSARRQIDRVAVARGLTEDDRRKLNEIVERNIEAPTFGVLGEPRVNVLNLNLEVDRSGI